MAIGTVAAPAIWHAADGTVHVGGSIDNGDGAHNFVWDTNQNGIPDHQVTINDTTGVSTEPDSLGLGDLLLDLFHSIL